ncbi:hypothetical protein [Polaribacter sp. Z022]|uniref:hypothetical protein n=1 Tax=Polaribacter sp. Z022 TaxID=2927125 RepID=UPI0020215671|nr:hypothetical protein [Polaribacter sp. Z022]MCL7753501.1 hypothetical protein [Polaribacter sp. Z022]
MNTKPCHKLNKQATFSSTTKYNQFLNWISGEFDLYLQDETNGLHVFFPEGKFHISALETKEKTIAEINLESKILEKGQIIFDKIMSVYNLLLKN